MAHGLWRLMQDIVPSLACVNVSTHHCHPTLAHLPLNHGRSQQNIFDLTWIWGYFWPMFLGISSFSYVGPDSVCLLALPEIDRHIFNHKMLDSFAFSQIWK